jgi:hypothetical protein
MINGELTAGLPGYKRTRAGWIPEHWMCVQAGDLFDIQLGKMVSKNVRKGVNPQPFLNPKISFFTG